MIKLLTDTSTLYTPTDGEKMGITVFPLSVTINNKTYQEFVDINDKAFYDIIKENHVPTSSQPPIGLVMETYEKYKNDDIVHITMADGLSGTYQSALSAKDSVDNNEHIHVINSETLCGPHRAMVDSVFQKINEGIDINSLLTYIEKVKETNISFLIPQDFNFLKRGGRLTPLAATLGGLLKIRPVMTTTPDGCRLEKFTVGRTLGKAVDAVFAEMKSRGVNEDYIISISHAFVLDEAKEIVEKAKLAFPNTRIELYELSCAFITQGGPQCIAIQAIKC